jgi:hypothetical protein
VVTLGPLAQIGIVAAGFWLFAASLVVACIVTGWIGQRIARRSGRQCPDCDYRAGPVDMAIHHALDHEREKQ